MPGEGVQLVGDIDFESTTERAGAITLVPGGVGPMTRARLPVKATRLHHDLDVNLP